MNRPIRRRRGATVRSAFLALASAWGLLGSPATLADDPTLEIGQYAHTSWTVRDGYSLGAVFAIAQTHDGYLWLGGEFGLYRFDGVTFTHWRPPRGSELPSQPYSLLVARDGTLWIGTFGGLVSWDGGELTRYPEAGEVFVTSLLEDRDGTIWAGTLSKGKLCEIRAGRARCHDQNGEFGDNVWSLAEDGAGVLWAAAESGLWRWKPGPPRRIEMPGMQLGDLTTTADGQLLISVRGAGLKRLVGDRVEDYPLYADDSANPLPDAIVKSNKLLRDRNGGLWIGTDGRGIIQVQNGKARSYSKADGLSGNLACSFFEDREGNIWFASSGGLDRFRGQTVTTISVQQGLSNDATKAVVASRDGSIWVSTSDGLTRWKGPRTTVFRKGSGLPDSGAQSLWADQKGRVWVGSNAGLGYFAGDRFTAVDGLPSTQTYSMAGDEAGNLWLSGNAGLSHFRDDRFIEVFPWSALGREQQAKFVLPEDGGVWLSFWNDGGVLYFKDGKVARSYTPAQGLGRGHVAGLRLDDDGALWAATEEGGLSRIANGRIDSLTTSHGLPCNTIHWSIEDDQGALWMNTACGLVRVPRDDLLAWISDRTHKVRTTVWGASDGVTPRAVSPAFFNPPVAKATDGKLWFVSGEGVQVLDPAHLPLNPIAPPVYVNGLVADRKPYAIADEVRLPPRVRDITIEYTALSFVDPKNMHFRYRLLGHDDQWQEVIDRREVTYINLAPGHYRFQVTASNNSGIWNDAGSVLAFSIAPAVYQTAWFKIACTALFIAVVWGAVHLRVRRLRRDEKRLRDVLEGIPAMAFSVDPDGSPDLVNQRWLDYTGLSASSMHDAREWGAAIHPADVQAHLERWQAALRRGEPFESEARHRSASGEYRWFLVKAVPLRDNDGRIRKWYGTLTDIEERKRAEAERERLRRLEARLAHTNRLSMLGELTASLAHEINQPIGAVIASAGAGLRWLDRETPQLDSVREAILRIKDDGKRAADIIVGLKAFYKKDGSPQRALLDVNEVVREILVLLHREAERHSIVMRTDLSTDLPAVRADRVQLQQVLMNLMVNGIESMGAAGGELIIETKPHARGVRVSVSDTGAGIPDDVMEQIFNAFFTTKAAGTGMGLAISRTIVESHEGKLWAEQRPGGGATFHFTLPPAEADGARSS